MTGVEEQFDRDFEEALKTLSDSFVRCARVAENYARVEEDLNEGAQACPQPLPGHSSVDGGPDVREE